MEKAKSKKLKRYNAAEYDKEALPEVLMPKPQVDANGKKKVVFSPQYKKATSPKKPILKVKSDHAAKLRLASNQRIEKEFMKKLQVGAVLQLYIL